MNITTCKLGFLKKDANYYIKSIFYICLYRITLEWIYTNSISEMYAHMGLTSYGGSGILYFSIWILMLLSSILVLRTMKSKNTSDLIVQIFFYVSFIPGCILLYYVPQSIKYMLIWYCYWTCLFMFNCLIPYIKSSFGKIQQKHLKIINMLIGIFLFLNVIYIWGNFANFRLFVDIFQVYGVRQEASNYSIPTIISYLFSMSKSIVPILVAYYMINKKNFKAMMFTAILFIMYLIDGSKTTLFLPVLVIALYVGYRYFRNIFVYLGGALTIFNCICILEELLNNTCYLAAFITRRLMFLPALINYGYYDFFVGKEKLFFRESLSILGEHPYGDIRISKQIGRFLFHTDTSANNGLFADAYANLGVIGIIMMPFILICIFRVVDYCSNKQNYFVRLVIAVSFSLIFISASFFTGLLSYGFVLGCILIILLPEVKKMKKQEGNEFKRGCNGKVMDEL